VSNDTPITEILAPEEGPAGFTLFAVLGRSREGHALPLPTADQVTEIDTAIAALADSAVVLRGMYDVTGMRATAELMLWLHGDTPEGLQKALRSLRRTAVLAPMDCLWSAMGVHREAEFNKRHVPGFLRGENPRAWLCVYPFVRSYEWYLLPEAERSAMLAEHGRKGAVFTDVIANTVSTFGLSDYEWLLPLESDNVLSLVDLMRDLRATDARRHVREEVPFFTGRRIGVDEIAEVLS
jgi:chlorite dismutase